MKEFKADEMTKVVVYTYVFIYTILWREFESLQTATLVGIPVFLSKFVLKQVLFVQLKMKVQVVNGIIMNGCFRMQHSKVTSLVHHGCNF